MAQLNGTFDATDIAPTQPFTILPPGKYPVQIVGSEVKATKDGRGQYLWLEFDIIDGEHAGQKLWDRLNLWNVNEQAVQIAQRTLSAICHAVGVMTVTDTEELHGIPMVATVRVREAKGDYAASNEIRGYEPMDGGPIRQTATVAKTAGKPAPAAKAPWQR